MSANPSEQNTLDRAAAAVRRAHRAAGGAQVLAATAHKAENPVAVMQEATEQAREAGEAAENALTLLLSLGAARPGPTIKRDVLRLDQLDTPAARRLLSALEEAATAGEALDRERGWVDADGHATGHGETLAGMALQLRGEIYGPVGRD